MSNAKTTNRPRPMHRRCSSAEGPQAPDDRDRSTDANSQCVFGDLEDGDYFELVAKPGHLLQKNVGGLVTNMQLETCGIFRDDVYVVAFEVKHTINDWMP